MNDSTEELDWNGEATDVSLIAELPSLCALCGKSLCLRQQVINLVLGNTEELRCLVCLASEHEQTPEQLLSTTKEYVMRRDCFRKEWIKYKTREFCPDKIGCFPDVCFR
jgi:hypothetical protein